MTYMVMGEPLSVAGVHRTVSDVCPTVPTEGGLTMLGAEAMVIPVASGLPKLEPIRLTDMIFSL